MTPEELSKAVEGAGGQSEVARKIGVTSQAVSKWCAAGEVPLKRLIAFEQATGVPREDLYPELFQKTPVATQDIAQAEPAAA